MQAYKKVALTDTQIKINETYEGVTIEQKIARILNNKEPITDGAPPIYTERKNGVQPAYNIRTDRFEVALDGTDSISKGHMAKREEFHKKLTEDNKNNKTTKIDDPGTGANTSDPTK